MVPHKTSDPLLIVSALVSLALCLSPCLQRSEAQIPAQEPAALLVYPRIQVWNFREVDTQITLANASGEAATAYCVYYRATGKCAATSEPCLDDPTCWTANPGDVCLPNSSIKDFIVKLTPEQVLGWTAKSGVQSESQLFIPPVDDLFIGELRCVVVSETTPSQPVPRDVLIGNASIFSSLARSLPPAGYSAIGIRSTGVNNGDRVLCLGGAPEGPCPVAEYVACPRTLQFNHFYGIYGGAFMPPDKPVDVLNTLTLVTCTRPVDVVPEVPVQILTYNEFEQRTLVQTTIRLFADLVLEQTFPELTVQVQGTLGGQTRLRKVFNPDPTEGGEGLLGVVSTLYRVQDQPPDLPARHGGAAHALTGSGVASRPDFITLPPVP